MKIKYSHRLDNVTSVWVYYASTIHNNRKFGNSYAWDCGYFKSLSLGEKKQQIRKIRAKLQLSLETHLMDNENLGFYEKAEILDLWMGE